MPVEASIEDLHDAQATPQSIQSDAQSHSSPLALEEKLRQEFQYHKLGNYGGNTQSDIADSNFGNTYDPLLPYLRPDSTVTHLRQDRPPFFSSVHSFTKAEPVHPSSHDECHLPFDDRSLAMKSPVPSRTHLPKPVSMPFIPQPNQERHPHPLFDRQRSWPTIPVMDTSVPEPIPRSLLVPSSSRLQDPGRYANLFIWQEVLSDMAARNRASVGFA